MKKVIFAMTIAAGMLTASFANAQKAEKTAPKTEKQTPAKAVEGKHKATGKAFKKGNTTKPTTQVKGEAGPIAEKKKDAVKTTEKKTKTR